MLTKYELTNVPDGGVGHLLPGKGLVVVDERLTDELAEEMIELGLSRYFKEVNQDGKDARPEGTNAKRKSTRSQSAGTTDDSGNTLGGTGEVEGSGTVGETPGGE